MVNSNTQDPREETIRFQVNAMAAIAKLVEARIKNDIAVNEASLLAEEGKEGFGTGVVNSASAALIENKRNALREQISGKKKWLELWHKQVWDGIDAAHGNVHVLQPRQLDDCLAICSRGPHGEYERFSVLQEAIFAPVYGEFEGMPKRLSETVAAREQARQLAECLGFEPRLGSTIYDDSDSFIKGVNEHWSKLFKVATAAAVTLATVTVIAAPVLAGVIGGLGGLSGAAAVTHGLALLGGGSIAAGGLGMHGGIAVLGATSGMFGAGVGGKATTTYLSTLPKEAVTVTMCKTVNYLKYLKTRPASERNDSNAVQAMVIDAFLSEKHGLERETLMLMSTQKPSSQAAENIRILHFTLLRISALAQKAS